MWSGALSPKGKRAVLRKSFRFSTPSPGLFSFWSALFITASASWSFLFGTRPWAMAKLKQSLALHIQPLERPMKTRGNHDAEACPLLKHRDLNSMAAFTSLRFWPLAAPPPAGGWGSRPFPKVIRAMPNAFGHCRGQGNGFNLKG